MKSNSQSNFQIDLNRIFVIGHSNGGLFSSSLALYYDKSRFAAICNHMGGISEAQVPLDFTRTTTYQLHILTIKIAKEKEKLIPLYIITGTQDTMQANCMRARRVFEGYGHVVKYDNQQDKQHEYQMELEPEIYKFFMDSVSDEK
jgi:predicted esterase